MSTWHELRDEWWRDPEFRAEVERQLRERHSSRPALDFRRAADRQEAEVRMDVTDALALLDAEREYRDGGAA